MVRPVCRDIFLLSQKAAPADKADLPMAMDLADTLRANADACVGMAANMIGVLKRIIAVSAGPMVIVMMNPVITARREPYEAEEGCLSLVGVRKAKRWASIDVEYQDMMMRRQKGTYTGFMAQIIQHEMDHLEGVLI